MTVLPDILSPGLRVVVCGTAAGDRSAAVRHYYANPSNRFWTFLSESGLTPEFLGPDRDRDILGFGLGLTDLAQLRSAATDRQLAASDFGVPAFEHKMRRFRPAWIAFHGKCAAKEVRLGLHGVGRQRSLGLGPQEWTVADIPVFVLPSASGSNQDPRNFEGRTSRLDWFRDLAELVPTGTR